MYKYNRNQSERNYAIKNQYVKKEKKNKYIN